MRKVFSNNVLALLALLFIFTSFGMNYSFYRSISTPTGNVAGEIRFCINHPPTLNLVCDSEVRINQAYFCDIQVIDQDGDTLKFYDNTSLFDIGLSSGFINFTPNASQVGFYAINISVKDDSPCLNNASYATLNLSILKNAVQLIVNTTANISLAIDERAIVDTMLEIVTLTNVSNASLNISKDSDNPTAQSLGVPELSKYITINSSEDLEGNLTSNIIKIFYTNTELSESLLHESSLGMYYFNQSWQKLVSSMDWVYETGINTTDQGDYSGYVWANISSFSIYSIGGLLVDEAPCSQASQCYGGYCCGNVCKSSSCPAGTETPAGGPSAGAGGGGGIIPKTEVETDFALSTDIISISLEQGQTEKAYFSITNTGGTLITFSINLGNLKRFVLIGANDFKLKPGEKKEISIDFIAPSTEKPEIYSGTIVVNGNSLVKLINVFIEIESKLPIFDVSIELLDANIYREEELNAIATITSMKEMGSMDVLLETQIIDMEGNIISSLSETIAVSKRTSILVKFGIPKYLKTGKYVIYSKVSHGGVTGSSSKVFSVSERPLIEIPKAIYELPLPVLALIALQITFTMITFILFLGLIFKAVTKSEKDTEPEEKARLEEKLEQDISLLERDYKTFQLKKRIKEKMEQDEEKPKEKQEAEQTPEKQTPEKV